ncbi:hypothetical protein AMTR_s00020p00176160 [Amborella trichopoda]|uniref:Uncharacterized protein n=1 Tax=Amborella trichopoda TaxID=13333 RepID=W1PPD2_AMBTC|nr:hypothetical protein AMTR_s00020p00176160 [Amborella trichopoda]
MIFGQSERGVNPSCEEGFAPAPSTLIEGESCSGSYIWASHAPKPPSSVKPKNVLPKEREDRESERKRKRGREPSPVPSSRERGSRSDREDLHSATVPSVPSHARWARLGARRAPDSPPAVSPSTPAAILRPADSWPGWSIPTVSVMPALEATQEEVSTSSACPSGLSTAQSSYSPTLGGPLGDNPLGFCATLTATTSLRERMEAFRACVANLRGLARQRNLRPSRWDAA